MVPSGHPSGERQSARRRLVWGALLSAVIHVLLFAALLRVEPLPPVAVEQAREAVRLKVLDRAQEARLDRERREAREAREALQQGQIIDIPRSAVEEVPDQARFLSRYDTRVEREQRSRHRGRPGATGAPGRPGRTGEKDERPEVQPRASVADEVVLPGPEADGRPRAEGTSRMDLSALGRMMVPSLGPGRGAAARIGRGTGGSFGTDGPSGSDDALLGVADEGETTMVNSRSFRYWDFFQRVKENVRGTWNPDTVYQSRDPTGKVYGNQDRLTVLAVELDAQGDVRRLEVVRESGLPFLDQEAVRALREAGPFRNPPVGLVDDSGRILFNFGFLLEVGASRGRFFWQRP